METIKVGDVVYVYTNAGLVYDANTLVWMVRFDGRIQNCWKNEFANSNEIREYNAVGRVIDDGKYIELDRRSRAAFEIIDSSFGGGRRQYVFRGMFKVNRDRSGPYRVLHYVKVSDEFVIR